MLRGDAAVRAMDEPDEKPVHTKSRYTKESASVAGFTAPRDWEKFVTGVMGPKTLLTGLCLLPIMPDWPADNRRSAMCVPLIRRIATHTATAAATAATAAALTATRTRQTGHAHTRRQPHRHTHCHAHRL